jgi:hypothetical protein
MASRIEDYGLIGDLHTAALVSCDGSGGKRDGDEGRVWASQGQCPSLRCPRNQALRAVRLVSASR